LLNIKGIGPETADDILTYALLVPSFVVDAYLRRFIDVKKLTLLLDRNTNAVKNPTSYSALQTAIERDLADLPPSTKLYVYQQFHALVVLWGKGS